MANIVWHKNRLSRKERCKITGKDNKVIWLTGLSGSGKSTIAVELEKKLNEKQILTYVLDGDNIRHGLNKNLGFSKKDRDENIRRVGEVTKILYEAGIFVICSFISPYEKERKHIRNLIGKDFCLVFVDCPLEVCEKRDTKGLYKKARAGAIQNFTGVSDPYEKPIEAEIILDSCNENVENCVNKIIDYLKV